MVLEKVINILAEYKECDPSEIHEDSTFEETLDRVLPGHC